MSRRLAVVALALAAAGCGIRSQDEPDILRTPPPTPTATPSATVQPTESPTSSPTTPAPTS